MRRKKYLSFNISFSVSCARITYSCLHAQIMIFSSSDSLVANQTHRNSISYEYILIGPCFMTAAVFCINLPLKALRGPFFMLEIESEGLSPTNVLHKLQHCSDG